jgi:hypothetical protein
MKNNKDLVISKANKKLDVPKLNEDEEAKFLASIYDAVEEATIIVLDRL